MGNGDMSRAWPIIGSLTRTVEYLQLSVEFDDRQQGPLLKPLTSLPPSQNWTQDEERRRVFWSIFNLDRYVITVSRYRRELTIRQTLFRYDRVSTIFRVEPASAN
jgi:hypothetical protein